MLNLQQNNSDCRITGPLKYYLEHRSFGSPQIFKLAMLVVNTTQIFLEEFT